MGGVPGTRVVELDVDGRDREFVLHIPAGVGAGPVPLVIDIHGLGSTATKQDLLSGMQAKSEEEGFVVAQPEADLIVNAWDTFAGSEDVAFIRRLVKVVDNIVTIDPQRIYVSGYSAGGGLTHRIACDASDVVAAVAAVAGAHFGWRTCDPGRSVPVMAFHGDRDFVTPYEGFGPFPDIEEWADSWASLNRCTPAPIDTAPTSDVTSRHWNDCSAGAGVWLFTIEGGGHGWPGTEDPGREGDTTDSIVATDLIWDFFEAHPMP